MIVPMLRLTLLCAAKERLAALNALRAIGCVHVALEVRDGEGIRRAAAGVASAEQALRVLDAAGKGGAFVFKPDAASPVAAMDFEALLAAAKNPVKPTSAAEVNRLAELATRLSEEAFGYCLALRRYAPFGEVDPATVSALAAAGLPVRLFKAPQKVADELGANAYLFSTEAGFTYGAWISAEPLPASCEAIPLPELSTAVMRTRAIDAEAAAATLKALLADCETLRPELRREVSAALADRTAAEVSANLRDAGEVAYLRGYLPAHAEADLLAKAKSEGWGVVTEEPDADDPNVPVLLEPPRIFRSIGVVFKGLGILPGYTEGDVSIPFYAFFSLFFAMLVGDAGYGALMFAAVVAAAVALWKKPAARPALTVFAVFSLSTILWGVLSGTYFGIAKADLPGFLTAIPTVGWLGRDANRMSLCFLIGAVHISIARLWNAVLLCPSLKMVGEIGWLCVTWGMFTVVCNIVVAWFSVPVGLMAGLVGAGVVLILIPLVADIKNEGVNVGMLPLNVISAMGDIISYVRLFAVGLASVKVAENFNSMALGLDLPIVLRVLAVVAILLIGHGLNLAMGALSVLVHAVRLNTLEFSNAKGITWAGQPYAPFSQPQHCQQ